MALTRDGIVDKLVAEYGLQRREAIDLYDTFIEDLKQQIDDGKTVRWAGFGSFLKKEQAYQRRVSDVDYDQKWRVVTLRPAAPLQKRIQRAAVVEARAID